MRTAGIGLPRSLLSLKSLQTEKFFESGISLAAASFFAAIFSNASTVHCEYANPQPSAEIRCCHGFSWRAIGRNPQKNKGLRILAVCHSGAKSRSRAGFVLPHPEFVLILKLQKSSLERFGGGPVPSMRRLW
jgi:hypothetical protein